MSHLQTLCIWGLAFICCPAVMCRTFLLCTAPCLLQGGVRVYWHSSHQELPWVGSLGAPHPPHLIAGSNEKGLSVVFFRPSLDKYAEICVCFVGVVPFLLSCRMKSTTNISHFFSWCYQNCSLGAAQS